MGASTTRSRRLWRAWPVFGVLVALILGANAATSDPGSRKSTAPERAAFDKATAEKFERIVKPFLAAHCVRCHGEEKQKGDLRLDTLARDFSNPAVAGRWM